MKASVRIGSGLTLALTLASIGCTAEEHKLAAEGSGDLSYVLEDRRAPDTELLEACGDGARLEGAEKLLSRNPYLQQVTGASALLAFTTLATDEVAVDVNQVDGAPAAATVAAKDGTARPAGDAWQGVAELQPLEPSTVYCYAIRDITAPAGFRTAPGPDSTEPVRFIAFGDSGGGGSYQNAVRDQMFTVPFDFVIHTGDIAYDHGTLGDLESQFFKVYANITRSFAVFPVPGNHDYETGGAAPYRQSFVLPDNGGPDANEGWYSFDWGNIHFAALDSEKHLPEQAAWLDADLAASDKPWKVVITHRPPYSSGEHGSDSGARKHFVPVIEKHGVQLVLNGHEHDYERTQPINGVTYVVTGGGGHGTRSVGSNSFTAYSEDVHHFVQVEVHDAEMYLHAIDGVGREFDSAKILL